MSTTGSTPARPVVHAHLGQYLGLTKREEFAKAAMQGLLADPEDHADEIIQGETCAQAVARRAVEQADALIEALNKTP